MVDTSKINAMQAQLRQAKKQLANTPKLQAPRPSAQAQALASESPRQREARIIAYLEKMPMAVSGSGGSSQTLSAACAIIRLGATGGEGYALLQWYNAAKCQPLWSEKELKHKWASAVNKAGNEAGIKYRPLADNPTAQRPAPAQRPNVATMAPTPNALPPLANDGPPLWDDSEAQPPADDTAPTPDLLTAPPDVWAAWWAEARPGTPNPDTARPAEIIEAAKAQAGETKKGTEFFPYPKQAPAGEANKVVEIFPQPSQAQAGEAKKGAQLFAHLKQAPAGEANKAYELFPNPSRPTTQAPAGEAGITSQTPAGKLIKAAWAHISALPGYLPNAPISAQHGAIQAAWRGYIADNQITPLAHDAPTGEE